MKESSDKKSPALARLFLFCSLKRFPQKRSQQLFFLRFGLEAFGTNFQALAAGFFGLKIDGGRSFGGDVRMRTALGRFWTPAANLANS